VENLRLEYLLHTQGAEANLLDGSAGEKDNSLQLFVVEEVVERPEASFLSEGVRGEIGIVTAK
jgi:hypothetical protein